MDSQHAPGKQCPSCTHCSALPLLDAPIAVQFNCLESQYTSMSHATPFTSRTIPGEEIAVWVPPAHVSRVHNLNLILLGNLVMTLSHVP